MMSSTLASMRAAMLQMVVQLPRCAAHPHDYEPSPFPFSPAIHLTSTANPVTNRQRLYKTCRTTRRLTWAPPTR